ncbi:42990_t:CDS:2, partial [Gigaspora margarita]
SQPTKKHTPKNKENLQLETVSSIDFQIAVLTAASCQYQIEFITNSKHLKTILETIISIPIYHYRRIYTMSLVTLLIALKTIIVTKEIIITIKYKETVPIPDTINKPIPLELLVQHIGSTYMIQFLNYNISTTHNNLYDTYLMLSHLPSGIQNIEL